MVDENFGFNAAKEAEDNRVKQFLSDYGLHTKVLFCSLLVVVTSM